MLHVSEVEISDSVVVFFRIILLYYVVCETTHTLSSWIGVVLGCRAIATGKVAQLSICQP
jgi:hypothetical protein